MVEEAAALLLDARAWKRPTSALAVLLLHKLSLARGPTISRVSGDRCGDSPQGGDAMGADKPKERE
jgi:hypothetical protein